MHFLTLALFLNVSTTATAMCVAGLALLIIGALATKNPFVAAHGLDKIVTLANLCCAVPLAVFGALHLFGSQFVSAIVPRYMPFRMFWVYFVGVALIAAALSIAVRIGVLWSGLLFALMMFAFVAMIHLPGAIMLRTNRTVWTVVFRETSFGAAGLLLAASALANLSKNKDALPISTKAKLSALGRTLVAITSIMFGVEHFFHPTVLPVVPLLKEIPAWVPARTVIDYVTGAALLVAGFCFLLNRKARTAATYLGAWILLLLAAIYAPVLINALRDPRMAIQIEGINYFADTLLFCGVILSLASASRQEE